MSNSRAERRRAERRAAAEKRGNVRRAAAGDGADVALTKALAILDDEAIAERCAGCGGRMGRFDEVEPGVFHAWIAHQDDCPVVLGTFRLSKEAEGPGGCDRCDAERTAQLLAGAWVLSVQHEDSCPVALELGERRQRAASRSQK